MSLSSPKNPVFITGVEQTSSQSTGMLDSNENATRVNQLHGTASNNALGAGIPNQVTNVQASIANAQTGSTCTVSVLYRVDPTDKNFAGVNIWVKGYNGNNQLLRVASGATSPTKFVLNNTGEIVSFTVQAYGNSGTAPLTNSPTCSGTLPQAKGGGFGSSTTTSTSSAATLQTNGVPNVVQTLQNLESADGSVILTADSAGDVDFAVALVSQSLWWCRPRLDASPFISILESPISGTTPATAGIGSSTLSYVPATSTVPGYGQNACPATNTEAAFFTGGTSKHRLDSIKKFKFRLVFPSGFTSVRIWIGLVDTTFPQGGALTTDTPSQNFVGFRLSTAAADGNWQAVCQTDATHQSKVDTGVTPDSSFAHTYEIRTPQGNPGTVLFFIDGNKVATIASNVPSSTLLLNYVVQAETLTSAVQSYGLVYLSSEVFA